MSVNPNRAVEVDLRFSADFTSPASDYLAVTSTSSVGHSHRREMASNNAQVDLGEQRKMDGALPEHDGMNSLRDKLHEIRMLAISTEEKAKMMHYLMTQDYLAHKATATSPMSLDNGGGNGGSAEEEPAALDVGMAAMPIDPKNPWNLRPGDLDPSWSPLPPNARDEDDDENMDLELPNLGCMHYKRNVKVQCFDCHRWFPCRHCHDSAHDLPFPHNLRRKMTRNMLCMLCQTPQPAAEKCIKCEEYAAYYYCPKCKLWDNDSNKRIYHCDDCSICRVGEGLGKDFVHCKRCNVCISISTSAAHPCVEGATERDCPLCLDDLFESQNKAVSMPCGHYMHGLCYQDLMKVTYKCPVCSKSAVNMELQWRKLDDEIRAQPMPENEEDLEGLLPDAINNAADNAVQDPNRSPTLPPRRPKTVYVGCNDCGRRSWTPFHWLGLKCQICDSYNANQMAPPLGHETEAERILRQQIVHRQHDFAGVDVMLDAGIQPTALRADSALDVPASPSQLAVPLSPGSPSSSASGLPSPRRYFVRDDEDEPRRPSLSAPRFSTPSLANLPEMPRLPRLPTIPNLPTLPNMPDWPNLPSMHLDIPRFSPYDVMDSLSRSLSPMRYYLQGLDVRDQVEARGRRRVWREREGSPTSVHSDPTGDARLNLPGEEEMVPDEVTGRRRVRSGDWSFVERQIFGRGRAMGDGSEDDDEDEDEEGSDVGSDIDSDSEDDAMRDDDDDDDEEDEDDELALVGHR